MATKKAKSRRRRRASVSPPKAVPAALVRVLCVHGIGRHNEDPLEEQAWAAAITDGILREDPTRQVDVRFLHYLDVFASYELHWYDYIEAVAKLVKGLMAPRHARGLARGDLSDTTRWTAGMVVQWLENDTLRRATRRRLAAAIRKLQPDFVLGHSLGSLIAYDTFRHRTTADTAAGRVFVSFGSQLGHPFVTGQFGGRIEPLPAARAWRHLFNAEDAAFTARLAVRAPNFAEIDTLFDVPGFLDHDATEYLRVAADVGMWAPFLRPAPKLFRNADTRRAPSRDPNRKALLIGIDDYPDPAARLAGCVNDVFLVSAVLQENGFEIGDTPGSSDEIRVLLDRRATASAIRERLDWLLHDARNGDVRLLYYSGHGARVPGYGPEERVDRLDECLVPADFDWSRDRAILDDQFYDLYSQLDYDVRFLVVLDCCHSGGMARDGAPRVRGLAPPDDIRHREIAWSPAEGGWVSRRIDALLERREFAARTAGPEEQTDRQPFFGESGNVHRIGRSAELRQLVARRYDALRRDYEHHGPYLPVILQACAEQELAYEYRHGAISHGAFTWCLAGAIRGSRRLPLRGLAAELGERVVNLGFTQRPQALYPGNLGRQDLLTILDATARRSRGGQRTSEQRATGP